MPDFELAVLYELSFQEPFVTVEELFEDLKTKLSRIFAARRVVLEVAGERVFHWGFGQEKVLPGRRLTSEYTVYEKILGEDLHMGRFWMEKVAPFQDCEPRLLDIYCRQVERTLRLINTKQELLSAQMRFREMIENAPMLAIHGFDSEGRILFWNRTAEKIYGFAKEEMLGMKVTPEHTGYEFYRQLQQVLNNPPLAGERQVLEGKVLNRFGQRQSVLSFVLPVGGRNRVDEFMRMDVDMSRYKLMEQELRFTSSHDHLTGLYNRNFFEREMMRLEASSADCGGIIVCDLDGLKLVNDTLGHSAGDRLLIQVAGILQGLFDKGDIVARVGGDEFAVLLTATGSAEATVAAERIKDSALQHNRVKPDLPLSLSVGFAAREKPHEKIHDLFVAADNNMSREKLHRSQSNRSAVVQTLARALEARDFITEGHADRLESMVVALARKLDIPEHRIHDLRLLAKFHDIGKVGLKDQILFKPDKLTPAETLAMRQHCAIGYHIAQASSDLVPIADWIYKHHEWWDGSGYPLGLSGENIPLECRILAIADAYDAMISDRPYRKGLPQEKVMAELLRCSGTQFDPGLVPLFLGVVVSPPGSENHPP